MISDWKSTVMSKDSDEGHDEQLSNPLQHGVPIQTLIITNLTGHIQILMQTYQALIGHMHAQPTFTSK